MKRKKITGVEKHVGRWFNRHGIIFWWIILSLALLSIFGPIAVLKYLEVYYDVFGNKPENLLYLLGAISLTPILVGIYLFVAMIPAKLPEGCFKEVERRSKDYPKLADRLYQIMKEAKERDNGLELRRFLSKIDNLEANKKNLAYVSKDYIDKIAALEKELGL